MIKKAAPERSQADTWRRVDRLNIHPVFLGTKSAGQFGVYSKKVKWIHSGHWFRFMAGNMAYLWFEFSGKSRSGSGTIFAAIRGKRYYRKGFGFHVNRKNPQDHTVFVSLAFFWKFCKIPGFVSFFIKSFKNGVFPRVLTKQYIADNIAPGSG